MNVAPASSGSGFLLLALLMLAGTSAQAGTVVLKNGDRLSGEVDSISGGRLLLDTEYAGRVPIALDAVESVTSPVQFHVRLRGGGYLDGRLAAEDGTQRLVSNDQGSQPIDLDAVSNASRRGDALADLASGWSAQADLAAALSTGNSETESVNLLVRSTLALDWTVHDWTLLVSREEADSVVSKEQLDFDYGYKRFFTDRWFALGNAEYYRDELKDIDLRITLGGGIGYQVWQDSFGALSVGTGVSAVFDEIGAKAKENPAWRWELDYNRFLWSKQLEFFHRHSLLVIPDSNRGEVIEASTGVRLAISDRLNTHFRVDHRIDTKPPEDAERTDVTYSLGVGFRF
ncbi:MAG: DUF481 domain-containing protein [Gammaproteobacteria bacterium]|nr:DUF481 domain-containing protein [Gammaproteobacteria bacterium]MDE0364603.1 DUF481 domain-containing protein [Gammaproteobacteria bacterium]